MHAVERGQPRGVVRRSRRSSPAARSDGPRSCRGTGSSLTRRRGSPRRRSACVPPSTQSTPMSSAARSERSSSSRLSETTSSMTSMPASCAAAVTVAQHLGRRPDVLEADVAQPALAQRRRARPAASPTVTSSRVSMKTNSITGPAPSRAAATSSASTSGGIPDAHEEREVGDAEAVAHQVAVRERPARRARRARRAASAAPARAPRAAPRPAARARPAGVELGVERRPALATASRAPARAACQRSSLRA